MTEAGVLILTHIFTLLYERRHGSITTMSSSYTQVNVHLIFHTKCGGTVIKEEDLTRIFPYIGGIIRSMSGFAYIIGGRPDHIHILTSLPTSKGLSDFVRDIKSNTSKWIKSIDSWYKDFAWQDGYGAFSVSESCKAEVIHYIENQQEHHRKLSSQEEFGRFLQKHGISVDNKYRWWEKQN